MTIPQLISYVGWPLFAGCLIVTGLHTVNLCIPGLDFIIPSSRIVIWPYVIGFPLMMLGCVLMIVGFFAERIHEAWIDRLDSRR